MKTTQSSGAVCVWGVDVRSNQHLLMASLSDVWASVEKVYVARVWEESCDRTHNQTDQSPESSVYQYSLVKITLFLIFPFPHLLSLHTSAYHSAGKLLSPFSPAWAYDSPEITKHWVAIGGTSSAVSRGGSSHMITVMTGLHDLIHLSPFFWLRGREGMKGGREWMNCKPKM